MKLSELFNKAISRLKKDSPIGAGLTFENWYLQATKSENFEESFYVVGFLPELGLFQSALIEFADWDQKIVKDVSGAEYKLGKISSEYHEFLRKNNAPLLKFIGKGDVYTGPSLTRNLG